MATPSSTEAAEIRRRGRHRLIGAIAIVAALVIFVPMLFDREPQSPQPEPSLEIPPKDKVAPLSAPAKAVTPSKDGVQSDPGLRRDDASPKLEGFAVQAGAFKDADKL